MLKVLIQSNRKELNIELQMIDQYNILFLSSIINLANIGIYKALYYNETIAISVRN